MLVAFPGGTQIQIAQNRSSPRSACTAVSVNGFYRHNEVPVLEGINMKLIIAIVILITLSACSTTSGWSVQFGVTPISQTHKVESLQGNQEVVVKTARAVAKGNKDEY